MKKNLIIFYIIWAVLACVQAYNMELLDDEAYYWVCSKDLDWGSFHTPPMVLLFVKIGYSFFQNEFGVRLLFLLAHLITIITIGWLAKPKDVPLFIAICNSF